ncbi:hypothetical protein PPGU16_58380 (plasmid) [Paraburkholderia largidicola]|uniref:Uncharacterized protein n=1 Tax=Paraburkholderia largidicola TaxID=3014751 RepID=A0A7I8BWY5_9BURK|nr:hypothetical protein PPGU16_58380 [Paraburkholderia sp. PGU16]
MTVTEGRDRRLSTHKRQRSFYKAAIRLGYVCDSKQEQQRTEEKQEKSCSKLGLEKAAPSWIAIWHRLGVSGRDWQAQKPSAQGVCEREHAPGQDKKRKRPRRIERNRNVKYLHHNGHKRA